MKRSEIHPDTFIFTEIAEINPSLEMVIHSEDPNQLALEFDYRKAAQQFFEAWGDETCDMFRKHLIEVLIENTPFYEKQNGKK